MRNGNILTATVALAAMLMAAPAMAQMNNEPIQLGTGGDGLGMSIGGQQAIIDKELHGVTPDHLVRDSSGALLEIERGPDHLAIVSVPGGNVIPGYKGRGLGLRNNFPFFSATSGTSSYAPSLISIGLASSRQISGWTYAAMAGTTEEGRSWMPSGPSSIDVWTAQVYSLGGI